MISELKCFWQKCTQFSSVSEIWVSSVDCALSLTVSTTWTGVFCDVFEALNPHVFNQLVASQQSSHHTKCCQGTQIQSYQSQSTSQQWVWHGSNIVVLPFNLSLLQSQLLLQLNNKKILEIYTLIESKQDKSANVKLGFGSTLRPGMVSGISRGGWSLLHLSDSKCLRHLHPFPGPRCSKFPKRALPSLKDNAY